MSLPRYGLCGLLYEESRPDDAISDDNHRSGPTLAVWGLCQEHQLGRIAETELCTFNDTRFEVTYFDSPYLGSHHQSAPE